MGPSCTAVRPCRLGVVQLLSGVHATCQRRHVETSETDATSLLGAGPVRWPQEIRRSRKGFYICCCASCPPTKRFAMLATLEVASADELCCLLR